METLNKLDTILEWFKLVRVEFECLQCPDQSLSKYQKPGFYDKDLKYFITEEKVWLRLNQFRQLKRNFNNKYLTLSAAQNGKINSHYKFIVNAKNIKRKINGITV